jgi:hypothetical protein
MLNPPRKFILGLDLGQAKDFTALAILERQAVKSDEREQVWTGNHWSMQERYEDTFLVRHLERPHLHTPYPEIVAKIKTMMASPLMGGDCQLVVDGTGVGRPVVDMLRMAGLNPVPVSITSGSQLTRNNGFVGVPKTIIVSTLQILFQTQRLKISRALDLRPKLLEELANFKMRITKDRNDTYEAWRESIHDDIVIAVALAAWYGEATKTGWRAGSSPNMATATYWASQERKLGKRRLG